jgi:hypothetical protein
MHEVASDLFGWVMVSISDSRAVCSEFTLAIEAISSGLRSQGLSRPAMFVQLNDLGINAAMGGAWSSWQVQRIVNTSRAGIANF